jgi:hypothetical protein
MNAERRTIYYVAIIFISGMLAGGTLMNLAEHYWLHAAQSREYDIRQHKLVAQEMRHRLNLTPAQQQQVDRILQQAVGNYLNLERRLAPQYDQVRQQGRAELRSVLNPAQRRTFDDIVKEVDAQYPVNERPLSMDSPCLQATAR